MNGMDEGSLGNAAELRLQLPTVVVVIDDDPVFLLATAKSLASADMVCHTATSGEGGLQLIRNYRPDLVLLDIFLDGDDGFAICREIRRTWSAEELPVIMVTGSEDMNRIKTAYESGANDFLAKPLHWKHLPYRILHVLEANRDVTERKNAEEALRQGEKELRSLAESMPQIVWITKPDGWTVYFNQQWVDYTGLSLEESYGHGWNLPFHPDDRQRAWEAWDQAVNHGGTYSIECRLRRVDGIYRWWLIRGVPFYDGSGELLKWFGTCTDIDDLKKSEAKLKAISRSAQDAIITIDPKGRVSFWNPAAERIFGFSSEETLGKDLHEIIVPELDLKAFRDLFPVFEESGGCVRIGRTKQIVAHTKEQKEIHVEISISGEHFDDGWHNIAIVRDISLRIALASEREMMQLQLLQAHKMEAVGQLAAGIAHEINTPIQYIGDNTVFMRDMCNELLVFLNSLQGEFLHGSLSEATQTFLKSRLDALDLNYLQEEIPKAIQQSLDGVARVSKIVSAMKEFSHPSMGVKAMVDLNRGIESTILVCRNEWKYLADLELDLDQTLTLVPCIADEFNQVILNLVINAAHAIEAASVGSKKGAKGLIRIITRHLDHRVEIHVSDTGTGIPENICSRIFDPFFTTKPVGKGSGQGLAIARSIIVDKHRGRIRVETEQGKGSTFIIELPLDDGSGSI